MAQIPFRANLANDDFPLLSALHGRTVIIGRLDQDYELEVNTQNRLQKEKQIPQAYYVHNVMPSGQGYQSIGYIEKIPAKVGTTDFRDAFIIRDPDENKALLSPSAGKNYIFDRNFNEWRSISPILAAENALVTVAYIEGDTYIYYEKIGAFKYNRLTQLLDPVVLVGLVAANINGICSANGFLLAWDDLNNIYRSQAGDVLNFTPDPALGSGSGIPEDIRGKIVILLPIANGFIVYTTANAVGAVFQQNIRYPFIYREIEGSAGIIRGDHVSWQDNLGEHYVWTIAGLQKVNKTKAAPIFPEATDFIVSKIFEDFNTVTNTFEVTKLASQVNIHLTVVGARFIVISYGIGTTEFTHAIVHDLAYKRFGKLKINHVDCFTYFVSNLSGEITWEMLAGLSWDDLGDTTWDDFAFQVATKETPKEILAFLGKDGQVQVANFDLVHNNDTGVIILGKYQYIRERLLVMDEIHVENVDQGNNFDLILLSSMDGKNISKVSSPFLASSSGQFREYKSRERGLNHSIGAKGTFHLASLELVFHTDGRR
jgi:hypothetical protein